MEKSGGKREMAVVATGIVHQVTAGKHLQTSHGKDALRVIDKGADLRAFAICPRRLPRGNSPSPSYLRPG
jgi:hypothetical protein